MKIQKNLIEGLKKIMEEDGPLFLKEAKLLQDDGELLSDRFLNRSIAPHLVKLSTLFNRLVVKESGEEGIDLNYWNEASNKGHLRLAYFLGFMPGNAVRISAVLSELARYQFDFSALKEMKAIEFGSGPGTGFFATHSTEHLLDLGLPKKGTWALIERNKTVLNFSEDWCEFLKQKKPGLDWQPRLFHRLIDWNEPLLPRTAPRFNFCLMSYFLNESHLAPKALSKKLIQFFERHVEDNGLMILVEPALKKESRRILNLRAALLAEKVKNLKILTPCLGHQPCGALLKPEDWCHEEVRWIPPFFLKRLDEIVGLNHHSLPFSYLVIQKTEKSTQEILPALTGAPCRLVSPAHYEGRDQEFHVCGAFGKRKARFRTETELSRGDVLIDADIRGDDAASRIDTVKKILQ